MDNAVVGSVQYQGSWNASSNTPTITSGVGTQGHYYIVSVAGSTNIDGVSDWQVGDWIIFNGTTWDKIDNTDLVTSIQNIGGGSEIYDQITGAGAVQLRTILTDSNLSATQNSNDVTIAAPNMAKTNVDNNFSVDQTIDGNLNIEGSAKGIKGNRGDNDYMYISNGVSASDRANILLRHSSGNNYGSMRIDGTAVANWYLDRFQFLKKASFSSYTNSTPSNNEHWFNGTNFNFREEGISKTLKNGLGHLGSLNPALLDANDSALVNSFYRVAGSWTGSPFAGVNGGNQGHIVHMGFNSTFANQIFYPLDSVNNLRYRSKLSGTWGSWVEIGAGGGGGSRTTQSVATTSLLSVDVSQYKQYSVTDLDQSLIISVPLNPSEENDIVYRIKDDGITPQFIIFDFVYRPIGVDLPFTTTLGKTMYIGCKYNADDLVWDVVSVKEEA